MKIVVGLGNPGKQYERTRHNAGFITIDKVASKLGVTISTKKFKALIAETFVKGQKVILVKPQTYMNLSGEAVREVVAYYDAYPEDIIIISDDKDLDLGKVRIRPKGSSGGQNGIKSIIEHIGTSEIARIKVGIGKNPHMNTADYVMGKIDEETAIERAADAVIDFAEGIEILEIMNRYNGANNS